MRHRNQMKRAYRSPQCRPTEVEFEQALLVATARLLMEVDELENINHELGTGADALGSDMYFEF